MYEGCGRASTTYGGLNDNGPRIREALWVVRADSGEAVRLETDSDAYPVFWDAENFLYLRSGGDRFRRIRPAGVTAPSSASGAKTKPEFWTLRYPGVRVYPDDPPGLGRLPTKVTNGLHLPLPGGRRFLMLRNATATEPGHYEVVDTVGVVLPGLGGPLDWDSAGTSIGGFLARAATPDARFLLGELISGDDEHSGGAARLWMVELAGWKGGPIAGAGEASEPCLSPDGGYLAFTRYREGRFELHVGRLVPMP